MPTPQFNMVVASRQLKLIACCAWVLVELKSIISRMSLNLFYSEVTISVAYFL